MYNFMCMSYLRLYVYAPEKLINEKKNILNNHSQDKAQFLTTDFLLQGA
jgi:hypothetical protein